MFCLNHHFFQLKTSAIVGALAAVVCVSCDGAPSRTAGTTANLPLALEELEGFERGKVSITGRVTLSGAPTNPDSKIKVGGDDFCKSHGDISTERWMVSNDGGFADVVVTVVDAPGTPVPAENASIKQEGCVYRPHVSAISIGQSALIENGDDTFHNVRIVSHKLGTLNGGSSIENYGQPSKGSRHVHRFDQSGVYRLECDVHRWMRAWVFVHSNNHLAVTDSAGSFEIPYGLRDGVYKIAAHHHQFANPIIHEVEVIDGKATVDIVFDATTALN
ncbi:MAG: plastocyanin [Verrucomicrobiales bacterium]|jgi:plastocyanin